MKIEVVTDKQEIAQRRKRARENFEEQCIRRYGFVPFNERYLNRCWPGVDTHPPTR